MPGDKVKDMSKYPGLTKTQAKVYHLHEVDINPERNKHYTHKEIADKLGISTHTSEAMLYRARKRLADMEVTLEATGYRKWRRGRLEKAVELLNKMLVSLVDLLEEKGLLTHDEWDEAVKRELEETKGLKKV